MREIFLGGKQIRLRATPLALLFYRQEFGTDLIGDFIGLQVLEEDMTQFDSLRFLQLIWAMNKADDAKGFPNFEGWLGQFEYIDFADQDLLLNVVEEATDGFFRGGEGEPAKPS